MKKSVRLLALLCVLSLLLGMNAFAANAEEQLVVKKAGNSDITVANLNGASFDLTYRNDAIEAGGEYLVLVVLPAAPAARSAQAPAYIPSQSTICYINQVKADKDGEVTFADKNKIYPSSFQEAGILIAGKGLTNAEGKPAPALVATIAPRGAFLLGDVNQDGKITTGDMQRIYAHLNKSNPLPDPKIGDVNLDGKVSTGDMQRIYAHLNKSNPLN